MAAVNAAVKNFFSGSGGDGRGRREANNGLDALASTKEQGSDRVQVDGCDDASLLGT